MGKRGRGRVEARQEPRPRFSLMTKIKKYLLQENKKIPSVAEFFYSVIYNLLNPPFFFHFNDTIFKFYFWLPAKKSFGFAVISP